MTYQIKDLFDRFPQLCKSEESIFHALNIIKQTFCNDGTLFACGNGGSAADAEHMVGELMKGFLLPRKIVSSVKSELSERFGKDGLMMAENLQEGLRAVSLNGHPSLATAFGNDISFEMIFAQQIYVLGRKGDVLVGFTTSGNSVNIVNAFKVAGTLGIQTVAFTGESGGECASIVDCCIKVPSVETYKVQEFHLPVYHAICALLEEEFYGG
jgi:phosphoheptose isomerase